MPTLFETPVRHDWEGFVRAIGREGTPEQVHCIELFLDGEVQDAICARFGLDDGLNPADRTYALERQVRLQRFLGYDYVGAAVEGVAMPLLTPRITDDADSGLKRERGRGFLETGAGPITSWETFEAYPWPDPAKADTFMLEWFQKNLPDDMCLVAGSGQFAEFLSWLMGYETLCIALCEQPDLVAAVRDRIWEIDWALLEIILQFDRVKVIWGSDDMGFKGGTLLSPDQLREHVLPGHKHSARRSHETGRRYILHSCGELGAIMDDLIDDVRIDGKHSYEDVILPVTEAKDRYGDRISILGGIDVDFLCRADEQTVRRRVRETLEHCMPGGGYLLGTGNSVANYIPLDNYLAMLDEGRRFL